MGSEAASHPGQEQAGTAAIKVLLNSGWSVKMSLDECAAICLPNTVDDHAKQMSQMSVHCVEDEGELQRCLGDEIFFCHRTGVVSQELYRPRVYKLEPEQIKFEHPVWIGLAQISEESNGANCILRKPDLNGEWEVLESFICNGWIWAKVSHFCYIIFGCCPGYVSFAAKTIRQGINVQVKISSRREFGIGSECPQGPIKQRLIHNCQYAVTAESNDGSSSKVREFREFTWNCGGEATCQMLLEGSFTGGEILKIKVAGQEVFKVPVPSQNTRSLPACKLQNSFVADEPGLVLEPYRSSTNSTTSSTTSSTVNATSWSI